MTEILTKLIDETTTIEEVDELLGNPTDFPVQLVEKISLKTALDFWNGEMSYLDGDTIMNTLYNYWITNLHFVENFEFGEISWICYEAFDAGEYTRPSDPQGTDPVEKYTKPIIESLLRKHNLI